MYPQISDAGYKRIQKQFLAYRCQHTKASPTELLIGMHRLYETEMFGVSARDMVRGYQVKYETDPSDPTKVYKLKSKVRGLFLSSANGVPDPTSFPTAVYERDDWKVENGKFMNQKQFYHDLESQRAINLTAEYTARDMGDGASLLDSGIDTGYGTSTGVITPIFQDLMLRLAAEKTMWKNFVTLVPMPDMTFYFPMRNSKVTDNSTEVSATAAVTLEGRAGLDINIKYTKWEVNGWKFLRHFEITDEVKLLLGKFLNVQGDLVEDLAQAHALLWDYSIAYGMKSMLTAGLWRRWDQTSTAGFKDSDTEIPFGAASVLTTNAPSNYLFQDLSAGSAGKIYTPSVVTTEEFEWENAVARAGSTDADELLEGISALGTLLEGKGSKLEFIALPSNKAELLFNDPRISNQNIVTGITQFESENGYLGRLNIIGTSTMVDVWKYNNDVHPDGFASDDGTPVQLYPVWGGSYGKFWALGTYTPYYLRIDDGFQVMDDTGVVNGVDVLRSNETSVFTSGSRGSSWPLDYHHLGCLWISQTAQTP